MHDLAPVLQPALALAMLALAPIGRADGVDDLMRREMAARHIPGAVLAVVKNGQTIKQAAYGYANLELHVRTKFDTVFELGSVTKQFTATLVMMAVEEGKLSLEQPISELLPGTPPAWSEIRLRHLLGHVSGLKNINDLPGFELHRKLDVAHFVALLAKEPLEFKPGDKYAYRNTGYALAGFILARVYGKPYWQVLRERILQPLGMTASRERDPREIIPGRAAGYEWADGKLLNRGTELTDIFAAGALASNLPDLLKWNGALDGGKLLKRDSLDRMWTPGKLNDGKPTAYGLGWGVGRYRGLKLISHGGSTAGFSASICKFVGQGVTVIVLTNLETLNNAGDLARMVAASYVAFPRAKD